MCHLLFDITDSVSSITKLPVEILLDIFHHVADSEFGSHSLVACSHVCRQWRAITTTSPLLWARAINLADDSEEWVAMMIQRSAPHLLDVSWDYTFNCSEIILGSVVYRRDISAAANNICRAFSEPQRVRSINLRLPLGCMMEMVACIPTFMLNLRTLVLAGYSSFDGLAGSITPVLELRAPALHHLRIENFGISWLLFHPEGFCNLRKLTLCYLPADSRLSLHNLTAFLARMPLLQVLVIRQALQQSVSPCSTSRISFSYLHTVILEATAAHTVFLLESLATPCLRLLEVHSGDMSAQASTAELNHLLSTVGACARSTAYRTVEIHYDTTSIQVFGFPEVVGCDDAPSEPHVVHFFLEWSGTVPWDAARMAGSVPELLRHLCLPHVRSLCFIFGTDDHDKIPNSTWTEILLMYRAVQHLSIYGTLSTGLLDALLRRPTHSSEPAPLHCDCHALLPCLCSVVLTVNANFMTSLNHYAVALSDIYPAVQIVLDHY